MTKKSASRRNRDAQAFQAAGGKAPTPRVQRETSARVWFELKNIHKRSAAYITATAEQIAKYSNPVVLAKIAKNGKMDRFKELNLQLQQKLAVTFASFEALWNSHKDRKYICKTAADLQVAYAIIEQYQAFDIDFYTTYSELISEMNGTFNEALRQLLNAAAALQGQPTEEQDVSVVTDVVVKEPLPAEAVDVAKPTTGEVPPVPDNHVDPEVVKAVVENGSIGRGLTTSIQHLDDAGTATDAQGYPEGENPRSASVIGLIGAHDAQPADSTVPAGTIEPDAPFEIDPSLKVGLIRIND